MTENLIDEEKGVLENYHREKAERDATAERLDRQWKAMIKEYDDMATTDEGINKIEAMLNGPLDEFGRIELVKYMRGMIAEIRRLRKARQQIQIGGSNNKQVIS